MKYLSKSAQETIALGQKFGEHVQAGMCFLLEGDLACGKTCFTKGIALGLGIKEVVNSPSFTIMKSYKGKNINLIHIDAYRLEGNDYDLGLDEEANESLMVIEWPIYYPELPNNYLKIKFSYIDEDSRLLVFEPKGAEYEAIVRNII